MTDFIRITPPLSFSSSHVQLIFSWPSLHSGSFLAMALMTISGVPYNVYQVNGQRLVGPPEVLKHLKMPDNCEVFISNIPPQLTEWDIMPMLSCFGCVFQLRLMMKISGENRGFCYAMYAHEDHAKNAIKNLNNYIFHGNKLRASVSRNRKQLILGRINSCIPNNVILNIVHAHIHPVNVHFFEKFNEKSLVMDFANHRDAAMAKRNFSAQANQFGNNVFFKWYN